MFLHFSVYSSPCYFHLISLVTQHHYQVFCLTFCLVLYVILYIFLLPCLVLFFLFFLPIPFSPNLALPCLSFLFLCTLCLSLPTLPFFYHFSCSSNYLLCFLSDFFSFTTKIINKSFFSFPFFISYSFTFFVVK